MSKKLVLLAAVVLVGWAGVSQAAVTYEETLNIYQYSIGGTIGWTHTYDHSADPIASATLSILADDVDIDENDAVYLTSGGSEYYLGDLNQLSGYSNWGYYPGPGNPDQPLTLTVFNLDPSWIVASMPVEVRIDSDGIWGVEIEKSTLTVTSVVPAPGAMILGSLGVGLVGWLRKRRTL